MSIAKQEQQLEVQKFQEIYEKHPDLRQFMQKRILYLRGVFSIGLVTNVMWVASSLGEIPTFTVIFSFLAFICIAAVLYACMGARPNMPAVLLAILIVIFVLELIPFFPNASRDTPLFLWFAFVCSFVNASTGISIGFSGQYMEVLEETFLKYDMKFIVQSSFVAIFYIMCVVIAVKMLLPENKKKMERLCDLSKTWPCRKEEDGAGERKRNERE